MKIPYLVRTIGISPADGVTTYIEKVDANPQLDGGMFIKPVTEVATPDPIVASLVAEAAGAAAGRVLDNLQSNDETIASYT